MASKWQSQDLKPGSFRKQIFNQFAMKLVKFAFLPLLIKFTFLYFVILHFTYEFRF